MTATETMNARIEAKEQNDANKLKEIGRDAYSAIAEMVAALNCDYDRLEELREERKDWEAENPASFVDPNDPRASGRWALAFPDEAEELAELIEAAGDCEDREEAERRIQEDALTVEVRSDWHAPGDKENATPSEFRILLATGGPAVQIRGKLYEHGDPCTARLEVQDWGTPWTRYYDASEDVLLAYAQRFYFSE